MPSETLTVTDNRTGRTYTLPITANAITATDLRQIKGPDDAGADLVRSRAPQHRDLPERDHLSRRSERNAPSSRLRDRGSGASAAATSRCAYLILEGELPNQHQLDDLATRARPPRLDPRVRDALHRRLPLTTPIPMGMLMSTVAALSTFYPGRRTSTTRRCDGGRSCACSARCRRSPRSRTASATGCRSSYPDLELSYVGNFLSMMFRMTELALRAGPGDRARARRAVPPARRPRAGVLDHDHALRGKRQDGPVQRGGGGDGGALRPLPRRGLRGGDRDAHEDRRTRGRARVRRGRGALAAPSRRASATASTARTTRAPASCASTRPRCSRVTGRPRIFETALALEDAAASDAYFIEHALYPTVDFYETIIYHAIGFLPRCSPCCSRFRASSAGRRSGTR